MATTMDDVASLARAMLDAEALVEIQTVALKAANERLRLLREETIPCVMEELGLDSLKLSTGQVLSVKQEVYVSLPKDEALRALAFDYLLTHDGANLIKTEVTVQLDREQWDEAVKLCKQLEEDGYAPLLEQNVHPQTLKAFIRECLAEQTPIDLNIFGARAVMTAKLK